MECKNCELKQRQFYCENCLRTQSVCATVILPALADSRSHAVSATNASRLNILLPIAMNKLLRRQNCLALYLMLVYGEQRLPVAMNVWKKWWVAWSVCGKTTKKVNTLLHQQVAMPYYCCRTGTASSFARESWQSPANTLRSHAAINTTSRSSTAKAVSRAYEFVKCFSSCTFRACTRIGGSFQRRGSRWSTAHWW